jgi:RNA polymerase sigma-70 factor (ECF subfamily)
MNAYAAAVAEPTDYEVVQAVLAGDCHAYATLVRRHNQSLYRACRSILRDDAEAEDAVQTAWINAYRGLAQFRDEAPFRTWLMRIAVREALGRARRRPHVVAFVDDVESPAISPERAASVDEIRARLERELDAMPETQSSVIVLRDILELDTAETAACLSISEEAVRVRLHRGRQLLADRVRSGERYLPGVWPFLGERCARVWAAVLAAVR